MNKYEQLAKSIRTVQWPTVTRPIYRRTCWIDPIWLCSAGSLQKSEGLEVKPGIFKGQTCHGASAKIWKNMEPYCSKHLLRLYVGFNRDIVRRCHCHCRHVTVWQGFGGSKHLRGLWSIEATDRDFGASNEILT